VNLHDIEPTLAKLPLVCTRRVLFAEIDKMNLVYGSHYLTWFEHGRTEYLRRCGLPYTEVEERGVMLPVFESHVWHIAPIGYDDLVEIRCAITEHTKASATFLFALVVDGERVAAGYTRHACLGPNRKPARLPDWLRDKVLERVDVGM
jgi:acyl-CoA thioester hydrolase